ncbi:MAG: glycoside hydrolase family 66 protein, partial [Bacillota bacterium]
GAPQAALCITSNGEAVVTTEITTDKARYAPGEAVRVTLCLAEGFALPNHCRLTVYAPGGGKTEEAADAPAIDAHTLQVTWQPPDSDFCGYLLRLTADAADGSEAAFETAVDVSSSWVRFPRYGYLWDFTKDADVECKIAALNRYHINGLQYYDWQYRHHMPLNKNRKKWQDWSARWIYGSVLQRYIAAAKAHNMSNMAYNMIYAANMTYLRDGSGVDPDWRLVKADGEDFTCEMSRTRGDVGVLQFFNILSPDWQRYIFKKEIEALDAMGFDGWHGDTIGEYGKMTTADGQALGADEDGKPVWFVKDGYTIFLNAAKAALEDRFLTFNPVGAQGIEKVSVSDVDVLYSEFWPWEKNRWGDAFDTYRALQVEIFDAAKLSGGKSLVLAAYVNYKASQPTFNEAAVRLLDALAFASGGARIALGNGDNMLSNEYFPGDVNKAMTGELRQKTVAMYDFVTAYQNLLRGGLTPADRTVVLGLVKHSTDGGSDTVWTFAMAGENIETLHFINLIGTDNLWRDEEQMKREPQPQQDIRVRYYTEFDIQLLFWASPDGETLAPQPLEFTVGRDDRGRCVAFTLPALAYWSMVFMR